MSSYKPANPNRTRKRCKQCASGKHSLCTGMSANKEGVICPCCGNLSHDERLEKENEIIEERAQRRYQRAYNHYAGCFDAYLRIKISSLEPDCRSSQEISSLLPKNEKDLRDWSREIGISRKWLLLFIEQARQDYPEH